METWFAKAITGWYLTNKRDLPWRHEKDAYKIWLSEIILQQTQVNQGLSYYLKFLQKYPTVKQLALAPEDEVLHLWQGLGYYSRARNLHTSAKSILKEHKGVFPTTYAEIRSLKGVGDYTAAAIASFAFNLPHAVVDGNVYRLLSRVFGIATPIDSSEGKKQFQTLASSLLDKKDPGLYNQAIMEFGSQYCRPVNPACSQCVLRSKCYAFKNDLVTALPYKEKKTKVRDRHFNYIVLCDKNGSVLIHKRPAGDIWQGLYEFCLIETEKELTQEQLFRSAAFKALCPSPFTLKLASKNYKHILSHQHLYARFYVVQLPKLKQQNKDLIRISVQQLKDFAFPRLAGKFLDDCSLEEIL